MKKLRLLIADEQEIIRAGLRVLLQAGAARYGGDWRSE
jgi:hypothetical protein